MNWKELLKKEIEHTYKVTEGLINIVDDDKLEWKPSTGSNWMTTGQILMHLTHETLIKTLSINPRDLGMSLLYDVCHNIAKIEYHTIDDQKQQLCVHRKGATRSLPPEHPLLSKIYLQTGQPVLIPGDMGTYSYILAGSPGRMI